MVSNCSKEDDNNLLLILIRTKRKKKEMNLNGSRKTQTWNENALLVVTVKALGNGVPVRTAFPSALSEWLDGCQLDRETFWASLHASWNGLGTESEPIQLPSFLASKNF